MTGSSLEFPRERESENSVQSFAVSVSTDSHAIAPGKPIQTDFSSEAKLRRLTVGPLWADQARKVRAVAPPPDRGFPRELFRGMDLRGAKVRVFASHAFFAHKSEQLHQMKLLQTAMALFFVHPREVMGVETPPPDLSFVHTLSKTLSPHHTQQRPTIPPWGLFDEITVIHI